MQCRHTGIRGKVGTSNRDKLMGTITCTQDSWYVYYWISYHTATTQGYCTYSGTVFSQTGKLYIVCLSLPVSSVHRFEWYCQFVPLQIAVWCVIMHDFILQY
jgi:hypothetical protein